MNSYALGYLDALQEIEMEHPPGIAEHEIQARREAFLRRMEENELRNARLRIEKKYRLIRENGIRTPCYPKKPLTGKDLLDTLDGVFGKLKS